MLVAMVTSVSALRQRVRAIFHRSDKLKAESAERRERWNQVITEHQRATKPEPAAIAPPAGGAAPPNADELLARKSVRAGVDYLGSAP
jgi:hypothetical protein